MQQPVHLPDFVPEDLQQAYGEEARRSVRCHTASRFSSGAVAPSTADARPARRVPRTRPASDTGADRRLDLIAALLIALPGAVLLSALWAWLAVTTDHLIWWFPATGGLVTVAALAVTVWRVRANHGTTARHSSRAAGARTASLQQTSDLN